MEYEVAYKRRLTIELEDEHLNKYFVRPADGATDEESDNIHDRLTEALDAITTIIRYRADVGDLRGCVSAYDDEFQDGEELLNQITPALKAPHEYWCMDYDIVVHEEEVGW